MAESVEDALPSWPGLRPRPGGELVVLVDDAPLADGHALLLHLVARALRQGHRVCLLSAAAEAPRAHCAAVLRKLGADRAQIDGAFACLPLLPPLVNDGAATEFAGGPAWRQALLRRAADFFGSDAGSEGGKGEGGGTGGGRVLVLDDASLAAGVLGPRAVVELVEACRALLRGQQEQEPEPGSLLVRAMDGDDGDDEGTAAASVPLLPLLLRHADALVEVRPLASGYSWDVHGLIRVRASPGAGPELVNFRLGEGGIRCDRITIKS